MGTHDRHKLEQIVLRSNIFSFRQGILLQAIVSDKFSQVWLARNDVDANIMEDEISIRRNLRKGR